MSSLYFFLKTLAWTFLLVLLLQIQVGGRTLEQRAMAIIHESRLVEPIQDVGEGAAKAIRNLANRGLDLFNTEFGDRLKGQNRPGQRSLGVDLERSEKYIEEARKKVREMGEKWGGATSNKDPSQKPESNY